MADVKPVEFRTFDGTILRGNYFPVSVSVSKTPIIVMTQGLTLLKEHYIPAFAARFQSSGIAALVYDHRSWGSSSGTPRNATDPHQQADDYHDAVLFAQSLLGVDPTRVAIWGIGHSAGACMIAAGDDPNVKAVVLVMPFTSGAFDRSGWPNGLLDKSWEDRCVKVVSNSGCVDEKEEDHESNPTTYISVWDNSVEQARGPRHQTILHSEPAFKFISGAKALSDTAGTPWENKITLDSLYRIAKAEPRDHIYKIAPRPLLYLAAIEDAISGPYEMQEAVFERAGQPKEWVKLEDHHVGNYFGQSFEKNISAQIAFLKKNL